MIERSISHDLTERQSIFARFCPLLAWQLGSFLVLDSLESLCPGFRGPVGHSQHGKNVRNRIACAAS